MRSITIVCRQFFIFQLIALSTLFLTIQGSLAARNSLDRISAVVGGQAILSSEVERLLSQLKNSSALLQIYGLSEKELNFQRVLELKIDDAVVSQFLSDLRIEVSENEVQTQISRIAAQNGISVLQLREQLRAEKITYENYAQNIRAQLERKHIFDRELRSGGGVSEAELRQLYREQIGKEFNLKIISLPQTSASQKLLKGTQKELASGRLSIEAAAQKHSANDIGWMSAAGLRPDLRQLLLESSQKTVVGPKLLDGRWTMLLISGVREGGNEEDFQKNRPQLTAAAQAMNFENRFRGWLDQKKRAMHIVLNK